MHERLALAGLLVADEHVDLEEAPRDGGPLAHQRQDGLELVLDEEGDEAVLDLEVPHLQRQVRGHQAVLDHLVQPQEHLAPLQGRDGLRRHDAVPDAAGHPRVGTCKDGMLSSLDLA